MSIYVSCRFIGLPLVKVSIYRYAPSQQSIVSVSVSVPSDTIGIGIGISIVSVYRIDLRKSIDISICSSPTIDNIGIGIGYVSIYRYAPSQQSILSDYSKQSRYSTLGRMLVGARIWIGFWGVRMFSFFVKGVAPT